MASRKRLIAAVAFGALIVGSGFAISAAGTASPPPSAPRTGTAVVIRTTITSRQQISGTLGYGPSTTLLAPQGATPAQVAQAQATYNEALIQFRNASAASSASEVDAAQGELDRVRSGYEAAKISANAHMDSAYVDLRAYGPDLASVFSSVDATLGELPLVGDDARSAQIALSGALAPSANARNLAPTLLGPSVGEYQRARDALAVAIAAFDRAADAGADTAPARTSFTPALTAWNAAATRVANAVDATSAPLLAVSQTTAVAQGALNAPLTRYNALFDKTRSDLSTLQALIATEQQRAEGVKAKIAGAAADMTTVTAGISGSLATAAAGVVSAARQVEQASQLARNAGASAQAQLAAAAAALATIRASAAVGPGTVSWLPRLGALIGRGDALYAVDGKPVPLLIGALPLYRSLSAGSSGTDVRELEDNLVALGFPATVDGAFDENDAEALRSWQSSLGVTPTGRLDLGEAIFVAGPARIALLHVAVGSPYAPGEPIVDVTASESVVSVSLDASLQSNVKLDDTVSVQIPGRSQAVAGKVADIATVAQVPGSGGGAQQGPARATINVTIRLDDPAAVGSLDQAPVRAAIIDQVRTNVVAVPVTSLVARSDGSFVVRVVRDTQRQDVVVVPGVFGDNGLVEATSTSLRVGDLVEVPQAP